MIVLWLPKGIGDCYAAISGTLRPRALMESSTASERKSATFLLVIAAATRARRRAVGRIAVVLVWRGGLGSGTLGISENRVNWCAHYGCEATGLVKLCQLKI